MNVKKLTVALAATAATAALASGDADAYIMALNADGLLIPHVVHNGLADTTAVGLICRGVVPGLKYTVYWTFFDCHSNHITDGKFNVTANDMYSFVWANESGVGLEGIDGYLVFTLDTAVAPADPDGILNAASSPFLAGNAFQVDTTNQDVAYVPTLPLDYADYFPGAGMDLTTMDNTSIATIINSMVTTGDRLDMRYCIDGLAGGTDTTILVWGTGAIDLTLPPDGVEDGMDGTYTVNMYDDDQNKKSVNFKLDCEELNVFNPESIPGRPADFLDGFIAWKADLADPVTSPTRWYPDNTFVYSVIYAPAYGAAQTILATHN